MTIKDILFDYIKQSEGNVNYEEITEIILSNKPKSKWKLTHWSWYKSQIVSRTGKYHNLFSKEIKENISKSKNNTKPYLKVVKTKTIISKIIKFIDNSNLVEKELAIILGKVSHHIHPQIINKITKANEVFEKEFSENCDPILNTNTFFYNGSDCIFPSVKRPINKEKNGNAQWKNNIYKTDGTILNDNTYPRHIWTYLSMNKGYSGGTNGSWKKVV